MFRDNSKTLNAPMTAFAGVESCRTVLKICAGNIDLTSFQRNSRTRSHGKASSVWLWALDSRCCYNVLSSVSVLSYCGFIHARHPSRTQACNNRGPVGKRLNHACNVPVQTPCFLATFSARPGFTATLTNLLNVVAIVLLRVLARSQWSGGQCCIIRLCCVTGIDKHLSTECGPRSVLMKSL